MSNIFQMPNDLPKELRLHLPSGPVTHPDQDALEHNSHAKMLRRLLDEVFARNREVNDRTKGERKNTLSLLAGFGVGKSSIYWLLNGLLQSHLELELVRVGAWRYPAADLRVSMLRRIFELLECRKLGVEFDDLTPEQLKKINREFEERVYSSQSLQVTDPNEISFGGLLAEAIGALKGLVIEGLTLLFALGCLYILGSLATDLFPQLAVGWKLFIKIVPTSTIGLLMCSHYFFPRMQKHFEIINRAPQRTTTRAALATTSPEQLEILFHHLVKEWKATTEHYPVFFIDDVDRQSPDQIIHALDALRTFIEVGDCLFVVACDEGKVKGAVAAARGATLSENEPGPTECDDYLQRYFPHPYRLPPFEPRDMRAFVRRAVENKANKHLLAFLEKEHQLPLSEVVEILIHDGVNTPRQAIRLVDEFCNSLVAAHEMEKTKRLNPGTVTSNPLFLARLVVIRLDFEWMIGQLKKNPDLLSWLSVIEREGHGSLEDHALKACARFYSEGDKKNPLWDKPLPQFEKLLRFVSHTARHESLAILPFLYLNEYGEGGAWSDEFRREIDGIVSAGQAVQLRTRLEQAKPDQQERISEVIADALDRSGAEPTARQNAVEVVPRVFGHIPASRKEAIADVWAAAASKLSSPGGIEKVEIETLLPVLDAINRPMALKTLLPRVLRLDQLDDAGRRLKLRPVFSFVPLVLRGGVSDEIRKILSTVNGDEDQEKASCLEWARMLTSLKEIEAPAYELFGRGFAKRLVGMITDNLSREELSAEGTSDLLTESFERLWTVLSKDDRQITIMELLETAEGLHLSNRILKTKLATLCVEDAKSTTIKLAEKCGTAGSVEEMAETLSLVANVLKTHADLRGNEVRSAIDSALQLYIQNTDVPFDENLKACNQMAELLGETSLPSAYSELSVLMRKSLANNDAHVVSTGVPHLVEHIVRVPENKRSELVVNLCGPLAAENGHKQSAEAREWVSRLLVVPELADSTKAELSRIASLQLANVPWAAHADREMAIASNLSKLTPAALLAAFRKLGAYVSANPTQKEWTPGALQMLTRYISEASIPSEDQAIVARQILGVWDQFGYPVWLHVAEFLTKVRASIKDTDASKDATAFRKRMTNLISAHSDAWEHYSQEWPRAEVAHKLQIFDLMHASAESTEIYYRHLALPLRKTSAESTAEVLLQIARKSPERAERFISSVDKAVPKAELKEIGALLFGKLSSGLVPNTDGKLISAAARWCPHPNESGDEIVRVLANGQLPEMDLLASILNDYFVNKRDSALLDVVARALSTSLVPSAPPSTLTNVASALREAGLTSHEAVLAARETLKKGLREGDPAQKQLWNRLASILPPKSAVAIAKSAFMNVLGLPEEGEV